MESARPIPADLRAQIVADLTQRYGRGLHLSFNYDPRLIGGLRVKVGSDIFDGTVRGRLAALEERFRARRKIDVVSAFRRARGRLKPAATVLRPASRISEGSNDDRFGERHRDPHRGAKATMARQHVGVIRESRRRRRAGRRPRRRDAQRDARLRRRRHRAGAEPRRDRGRRDRARRLHAARRKATRSARPAGCCRCRSARASSAASSTRSASRSTARARSRATSSIRSRSWRPASSGAGRSASRCRPASCRSTR